MALNKERKQDEVKLTTSSGGHGRVSLSNGTLLLVMFVESIMHSLEMLWTESDRHSDEGSVCLVSFSKLKILKSVGPQIETFFHFLYSPLISTII